MEHVYLESAAQSISLRDENIPPPIAINVGDLRDPATISQRKREAENYLTDVTYKHSRFASASLDDVSEAERYSFGAKIATVMMEVSGAVPTLQNELMSVQLTAIQASMATMQASMATMQASMATMQASMATMQASMTSVETRLTAIECRVSNLSAREPEDAIIPPLSPLYGAAANDFPRTVGALMSLAPGELLSRVENFYNLPHTGSPKARISRVRKAYCIGLIVLS
jgi:uncharacterized coiled-coil protein SlyX